MSRPAYFVGPWDFNRSLACVPAQPEDGTVVLVESVSKSRALPFHKQKLVLVLSALHHFADELRTAGYDVEIIRASTYLSGIQKHVERQKSSRVVALRPREWGLDRAFSQAQEEKRLGVPLELLDDGGPGGHFLLTRAEFTAWAGEKKQLRMDLFYQFMRKKLGLLLDASGRPLGGQWSFDADNREHARGVRTPPVPQLEPDALTQQLMERVEQWPNTWGTLEGFQWPVTRAQALAELDHFLRVRAEHFGRYEDAMLVGERWLWHSRLSPALNLGLLHPLEVVQAVVRQFEQGRMPLASAEGFVRQIIGWREFIRGVYWRSMPKLRTANLLGAQRPLPDFYWHPERTRMRCMSESVRSVYETGYTHHIQRLMVLGNFSLLAGIDPLEVSHWFWAGFVDAFEWVELPNVHGMALFADDGFTTKPYAASGAYIQRMSNHCQNCPYDEKKRTGHDACPFNALYWRFLEQHRPRLEKNPRIATLYRTWDKWPESEREAIRSSAQRTLDSLRPLESRWNFADDQG